MKRPWKLKQVEDSVVQRLCLESQLSPLLGKLVALRGIDTSNQADAFLNPHEQDIPSPFLFAEMETAVERIFHAINQNERVLIHGDYDVDGVTGTCILMETLQQLGISPDYFLPDRHDAGYGIQADTIREKAADYDLLITVDCGTTAIEAVQVANEHGLDVIITDHHNAGCDRPPAVAVINPIRPGEPYPSKNLSGAGVAYKVAAALFEKKHRLGEEDRFLDVVVLGMVADVMTLVGENRTLLVHGLQKFRSLNRPGLQALLDIAKVIPTKVGPQEIGFRLGPRLNAAGRMDHPQWALELLLTRDEEHAQELASHLNRLNSKRQNMETKIFNHAVGWIEKHHLMERSDKILVVTGEHWHRGVLGIVASRLAQKYQRTVFLLSQEEEVAIGSARATDGIDLIPLIDAARPYSLSCGGHAGAAGMKVAPDKIEAFENALYEAADSLPCSSDLSPLWIDEKVPLEQIDSAFMDEIQRLAPFGEGNEEPVFYAQAPMSGMGARIVGNNHLRLSLQHPRGTFSAIGFGQGDKLASLSCNELELAFSCRWNEYQGRKTIDLHLRDVRPQENASIRVDPSTSSTAPGRFEWDRPSMGELYRFLSDTSNEEKVIAVNDVSLLLLLAKMEFKKKQKKTSNNKTRSLLERLVHLSLADFEKALTIFSEIGLLTIQDTTIQLHDAERKRNLADSPTYRAATQKIT